MTSVKTRPSPAWLVTFLVVVLACTGTAYAAGKAQSGDALIKKSSLSGDRLKKDTVTGKQVKESSLKKVPRAARADAIPTTTYRAFSSVGVGWTTGTVGTRPARYAKDATGAVRLAGVFSDIQGLTNVMATLPEGFRPNADVWLTVATTSGTTASILVEPTGDIRRVSGSTISLEGVSFPVAP